MRAIWGVVVSVGALCACGGGGGAEFSSDHPRIYLSRHKDSLAAALNAGQPAAMRFKAAADRWVSGADVYNFSPWNAALLGQLTGDAKYCNAATAAIDKQVTDATAKVASGQLPAVAGDSYLGVGNLIGNLALVYDWCAGSLSGDRREAWLNYADQAVFNVWNHMAAQWGTMDADWSGWAVDDPSNNYYYSFLRATVLLGLAAHDESPRAKGWLDKFQSKVHDQVVPTFDEDLVGGGSREGTGYGVALRDLFELYDIWEGSTGERIADLTKHTRASLLVFMHQIVPTLDRFAPTGDQSRDSTASFFDYHRSYLQDLIGLYPDDPLAPRAQALLAASSLPKMGSEFMFVNDFMYANDDVKATTLDGLGTAYYAPGIGEVYARSGWDTKATWVNLIAGPYTQSHAHQDQGSVMLYKEGWLLYDAVIPSHSGLPQQTTAHSLVRIVDGGKTIEQKLGTEPKLVALHRGTGFLHAAADLTAAYKGSPVVSLVQREMVYLEPDTVVIYDRVSTRAGSSQVFQLVSPVMPTVAGTLATFPPSPMTGPGKPGSPHTLTVTSLAGSSMTSVFDFKTDPSGDFGAGYRFDETMPGGDNRTLHVLAIDNAATNIVSMNDGVMMTVGGKQITLQFSPTAIGGSLKIDAQTTSLGATIDTLPE